MTKEVVFFEMCGADLIELRESAELSQQQLAHLWRVTQQRISQMESDRDCFMVEKKKVTLITDYKRSLLDIRKLHAL